MAELDWSDETSRAYARYMEKNIRYDYRRWATRILTDLGTMPPGATVVDVAGGPGFLALELGRHLDHPRLWVVDGSPTMLQLAVENGRKYSEEVGTRLGQAERLEFPDGFADVVVCKHFIRLSPDPERALREMVRTLTPGGRAYVVDFDGEAPALRRWLLSFWIRMTAPEFIRSAFRDALRTGFPAHRMVAMLGNAGLSNARVLSRGTSYLVAGDRPSARPTVIPSSLGTPTPT
jgi:ubiquinone/menaquinone biosynthesis C-methylase UbiE